MYLPLLTKNVSQWLFDSDGFTPRQLDAAEKTTEDVSVTYVSVFASAELIRFLVFLLFWVLWLFIFVRCSVISQAHPF